MAAAPDHEEFLRRWYAFVHRWRKAKGPDRGELVARALADGLPPTERDRERPPEDVLERCAMAVLRTSGAFDAKGYAAAKPNRVVLRTAAPLTQFVTDGWRELRAPSLDFDLWWYWCEHLDPTREDLNPLLHYLLAGRQAGFLPVPPPAPEREHARLGPGPIRRICLFAAYDRDGLVDDYVLDLLRELGRHADVYFLADGVLEPGELTRLDGVVAGAWSIPHGRYDFGSYSLLARDLVGWSRIEEYDELLLVNDSCFLLRPLDDTLAEMATRACDWWGLQATSIEFNEDDVDDPEAVLPLAEAKATMVGPRRWSDVQYLHLSSYFLAFRRTVVDDAGFRARLDGVAPQSDKMQVVHKYEVGISRYLMDNGFDFDTLLPDLHPFHPLYSRRFFELAAKGFPLVKRNFLAENPRYVADFAGWPAWLEEAVPDAPMDRIVANIERVSPHDVRMRAPQVRIDEEGRRIVPDRPLAGYGFRTMSRELAKHDHWWAFPVAEGSHRLSAGAFALLDVVRDDPTIRKVVLTRSRRLELTGENLDVLPYGAREAMGLLARCGQVLVDGLPDRQLDVPMPAAWHRFVHLGSGLPTSPASTVPGPADEESRIAARAVASRAEALARAAAGSPLTLEQHWLTGLPRHDLVTRRTLPADLEREQESLVRRLESRRLLVFWPRTAGTWQALAPPELDRLADWARRHDVVIGVRESAVDRAGSWTHLLGAVVGIGVSPRAVAYPSTVLRVADAVVTDDADEAVDFLLTGRPLIHWLPGTTEAGPRVTAHYPPEEYLPGPVCRSFDELLAALEGVLEPRTADQDAAYREAVGFAFAHADSRNAWRLAWRMRGVE